MPAFEALAGRRMADVDFAGWAAGPGYAQSVLLIAVDASTSRFSTTSSASSSTSTAQRAIR